MLALKKEDKTIFVVCGAIFVYECHDAFAFVVDTMFEMSAKAKREDVLIVSVYRIMNAKFVLNHI